MKYEAILSWFVTEFRKLSKQMGKSVSLKHSLIKTISFFGSTSQAIWSLDDRVELNSPVKGLEYERIVIALTERIGHDAPVTEVQNSAQIELMYLNTLIPFELRHISEPLPIGFVEGEEHFATYLFHRPKSNNDIPVFYDYF